MWFFMSGLIVESTENFAAKDQPYGFLEDFFTFLAGPKWL
jgi:hypothetical protein